ncbi:MAG: hypothetical protein QOE70_904 [Chthoniobacter sp.]|jgi:hypothetical protein|nr:hypothetical protein [Chthoniobacter sp.]
MKLPDPRGFARTSPSAAVCEHVENFSSKGKRATVAAPEPLDLAALFDLRRSRPYVRTAATRAPIPAQGKWSAAFEQKMIYLPVNGPDGRTKRRMRKDGSPGAEETMRVQIDYCTVTVTLPRGAYTLRASSRGLNVVDEYDRRRPLPMVRTDLARVLGADEATNACAALASVMPSGPRKARPRQPRPLAPNEIASAKGQREAQAVANREMVERRSARKAAPKVPQDAPDFAAMTAEEFAKYNAEQCVASARGISWVALDDAFPRDVVRLHPPREESFPAPFTGEELD